MLGAQKSRARGATRLLSGRLDLFPERLCHGRSDRLQAYNSAARCYGFRRPRDRDPQQEI